MAARKQPWGLAGFLIAAGSCISAGFFIASASGAAAEDIGSLALARNDVREIAPAVTALGVGSSVARNETVRTGTDSSARIVFVDNTNLSMGPIATMKMDASVYAGDGGGARAVSAKLTAGAFRFVTGSGPKPDYKIDTPLATVGVRGTILDFLIQRGREIIVLREGAARVCVKGGRCIDLNKAGEAVIITALAGGVRIRLAGGSNWTFDATCNGDPALCEATRYASLAPAGGAGVLCGR